MLYSKNQYLEPILIDPLTDPERQVLSLLAYGESNKEIARGLGIPVDTVRSRLRSIFQKLGKTNRTQLAIYAVRETNGRENEVYDDYNPKRP